MDKASLMFKEKANTELGMNGEEPVAGRSLAKRDRLKEARRTWRESEPLHRQIQTEGKGRDRESAKTFNLEFENIANKILEEESRKFTDRIKTICHYPEALGNLDTFRKKVEEDKTGVQRALLARERGRTMVSEYEISEDAKTEIRT